MIIHSSSYFNNGTILLYILLDWLILEALKHHINLQAVLLADTSSQLYHIYDMHLVSTNPCVISSYILSNSGILFDAHNLIMGCWEEINCKENWWEYYEKRRSKKNRSALIAANEKLSPLTTNTIRWTSSIKIMNSEERKRGRMLRVKERKMKRIIIKHRHHKKSLLLHMWKNVLYYEPYVISCIFPKRSPPIPRRGKMKFAQTRMMCVRCTIIITLGIFSVCNKHTL